MTTERQRHAMHQKLVGVVGEEADTLMELLPPVGWADVATKQDLEQQTQLFDLRLKVLENKVDAKFEQVATREQISDLRSEFRGGLVALLTGLLTSQLLLGVLYLLTK